MRERHDTHRLQFEDDGLREGLNPLAAGRSKAAPPPPRGMQHNCLMILGYFKTFIQIHNSTRKYHAACRFSKVLHGIIRPARNWASDGNPFDCAK
jgi:hypothetical protein